MRQIDKESKIEFSILIREEELKDKRKLPFDKMILMIICYVTMLSITMIKGSEHMNSLIGIKTYIIIN